MNSHDSPSVKTGNAEDDWAPRPRAQSSALSPQSLEVHIEALVLHGFAPGDRDNIRDAIQREFARLLTERGLPASLTQGGAIARLDAGAFGIQSGASVEALGAQVARAIYGGLGR